MSHKQAKRERQMLQRERELEFEHQRTVRVLAFIDSLTDEELSREENQVQLRRLVKGEWD